MPNESAAEYFREMVDQFSRHQSPMFRWTGQSLREIYLEGTPMAAVIIKGPQREVDYYPEVLRIIALREGRPQGITIAPQTSSDTEGLKFARLLREEYARLPYIGPPMDTDTLTFTSEAVAATGHQVLAALELGRDRARSKLVQVLYPKVYMTITQQTFASFGLRLDEQRLRESGFALALNFLRSVPFTNDRPQLLGRS